MAATRTPGITVHSAGHRIIDKEHRGVRIFTRLGAVGDQEAEDRLHQEIARVEAELHEKANRRPRFSDCAAQYLFDSRGKRRVSDSARHVRQLLAYVGTLEPRQVHDGTLRTFVADRLSVGVSPTTINHGLKVVRTILNRAARVYRDDEGQPWLDCVPPQITFLPESRRPPYPITWQEQDRLFPRLPAHLGRMALFAINTGLRAGNVCSLQWSWEVFVPEVGRSVFVIPAEAHKTKRAHVAVLNDVAWSIVQAQRDKDKVWVFPYRGKPVGKMNNTAWKNVPARVLQQPGMPNSDSMLLEIFHGCAFTICDTHLGLGYVPPGSRRRTGKRCSVTRTDRWRVTTRVPTSGDSSRRRISS